MKYFLKSGAYIWHPLLMPLLGTILYFLVTSRYFEPEVKISKILVITILTFALPLVLFFFLKNLRVVKSIHLKDVQERKWPLMIQCVILIVILRSVFDNYIIPELYYFFVGILFSSMAALLMVYFSFKISLHQMAIAGLTVFAIALSIHFQKNLLAVIALLFFANGWVASSRLYTHSHSPVELIFGFFMGAVPQFLIINFWL